MDDEQVPGEKSIEMLEHEALRESRETRDKLVENQIRQTRAMEEIATILWGILGVKHAMLPEKPDQQEPVEYQWPESCMSYRYDRTDDEYICLVDNKLCAVAPEGDPCPHGKRVEDCGSKPERDFSADRAKFVTSMLRQDYQNGRIGTHNLLISCVDVIHEIMQNAEGVILTPKLADLKEKLLTHINSDQVRMVYAPETTDLKPEEPTPAPLTTHTQVDELAEAHQGEDHAQKAADIWKDDDGTGDAGPETEPVAGG